MFIAGGAVALVFVLSRRLLGQLMQCAVGFLHGSLASTLMRMPPLQFFASGSVGRLPFAIAIGIGTVGFVVARQLGTL
jgi:prepilin peptidase CpaA